MSETRIYVIMQKGQTDPGYRLVEATSAAQAIRYCASNLYEAKAAVPKEIARFMSEGVKVEQAFDPIGGANEQTKTN